MTREREDPGDVVDPRQVPEDFGIGQLFWLTSDAIVAAEVANETIVLWNPAAEGLFGYPVEIALGMPLDVLVPADLRDAHHDGIERYASGGQPVLVGAPAVVVPAIARSGEPLEVALSLTAVPLPGRDGTYVLAVIRDVTAQRRAERQAVVAREAMEHLLAAVSHDLRNPLSTISGFAKMLRDGTALSADRRQDCFDAIDRQAERASRLVDDLLTLSQIDGAALPTRPETVSVRDAAAEAIDAAGVHAAVDGDLDCGVVADPSHLRRILVNYLTNAGRYGAAPIDIVVTWSGDTVQIRVRDAGPGVPATFVEHLFSRYARAEDTTTGLGLGLSIVRGLAEANHGRAFHEPLYPAGASFGVELPAP